jgi:hypothetical protein
MKQRLARSARKFVVLLTLGLIALLVYSAHAQYYGGRRYRRSSENPERVKEQEMMTKALNPAFTNDVFTFARLVFEHYDRGWGYGGRQWDDDSPQADLNLIFRLYQVTSLKVSPGLHYIDITTDELPDYPFVYLAASGKMILTDEEVLAMRNYLLNGGFLMADDFWGDDQWHHFYAELKKIFPDREPVELTLDHPIFHNVYNFKKEPQIPSVGNFLSTGLSYDSEYSFEEKNHDPHYYGVYDDKHRMMVLVCHNNHYGDGWEHEGDDMGYFDTFSLRQAYPMLLNILVYAMEH